MQQQFTGVLLLRNVFIALTNSINDHRLLGRHEMSYNGTRPSWNISIPKADFITSTVFRVFNFAIGSY